MQLTRYTDYSLRVLLYLAVDQNRNPPVTVDELSQQFQISRNHLVKIVHELGQRGLLLITKCTRCFWAWGRSSSCERPE